MEMKDFLEARVKAYNNKKVEDTHYNCELCLNRGDFMELKGDQLVMITCECYYIRQEVKRKLREIGADSWGKWTFDNFNALTKTQKTVKQQALDYLKEPNGKWFYIGGKVGSGKSHITNAIYDELIKRGYTTKYMSYFDLQRLGQDLKSYDTATRESAEMMYNRILKKQVLFIDDIFKGKQRNDHGEHLTWQLLNERYNLSSTITLITAEMTYTELLADDESLASRIYERAEGYVLEISENAKNYRIGAVK